MSDITSSGIYKITSPSGRVYIGQAVNLERRFKEYIKLKNKIKTQTKLYNSLKKYGVENHQFDIIEYCTREELNCSERFWQDEFDVLGENGLNCILQKCDEKKQIISEEHMNNIRKFSETRVGKPDYSERKTILCLRTGIFYFGIEEADKARNISKSMVTEHLTRLKVNRLDLIYI